MNFFFVVFQKVEQNEKKMSEKKRKKKKKKKGFWQLGGLLPISQPCSRYNILYRDTGGAPSYDTAERVHAGARRLRYDQPPARHGPTTRPASAQGRAAHAQAHGLARGELRYKKLYRGWGRPFVSQYGAAWL